jgi:hypothetical protein
MLKRLALAAGVAGALLLGATAVAGENTKAGEFTIYHSAFNAEKLTPEIAAAYHIQRSKYIGVLNVSVIRERPKAIGTPVKALVDVDLAEGKDRKQSIAMHEVESDGGVSYLGEFPIADGQELEFEIRVRPTGVDETTVVLMKQEFFTE